KVKDAKGKIMKDGEIAKKVEKIFDLRPYAIVERFSLKNPIFQETTTYGHFGRTNHFEEVEVYYQNGTTKSKKVDGEIKHFKKVEFFAWEKLDYVDKIKKEFKLK
ncbi:MAG TPA: methionine adenosyltransferase domain-containing protein, partial [Bacteroidales bacterium]|nr:methionine adenosyltransferase domain-containing protein [Bacteroidales bacterium]